MKVEWTTQVLATLDDHLSQVGPEIAELRAAGVSERRITALYPFDDAQYAAGIERLIMSRGKAKRLRKILEPINVPYRLDSHLPQQPHDELWKYMYRFDAQGNGGPHVRIGHYSPTLYAHAVARDLVGEVETMLHLPMLLHVLADYPFAGQQWDALNREDFEETLSARKPRILEYAELVAEWGRSTAAAA